MKIKIKKIKNWGGIEWLFPGCYDQAWGIEKWESNPKRCIGTPFKNQFWEKSKKMTCNVNQTVVFDSQKSKWQGETRAWGAVIPASLNSHPKISFIGTEEYPGGCKLAISFRAKFINRKGISKYTVLTQGHLCWVFFMPTGKLPTPCQFSRTDSERVKPPYESQQPR